MQYDEIIIGAGPAGLKLAYPLKAAGHKVAVVERDLWGGTCPNRGCDPKKVLYHAVTRQTEISHLQGKGYTQLPAIDWSSLMDFKMTFTKPVSKTNEAALKQAGIDTIFGVPTFKDQNTINIDGTDYQADHFVIATGQRPTYLDIPGKEFLKSSTDFLNLKQLPKRIVVIGGGYIAFELANIALTAGAEVSLIQHNHTLLREFPSEIVTPLVDQLRARGLNFALDTNTLSVGQNVDGLLVSTDQGDFDCDYVLCATGRTPNDDTLDLDKIGIHTDRHGIIVNDHLQTAQANIYAVGDVVSRKQPKLTPVATMEASYVTDQLLNKSTDPIQYPNIPTIVYSMPQIAETGISLADAKADPNHYQINDLDLTNWFTYHLGNEPIAGAHIVIDKNTNLIVGADVETDQAEYLINQLTWMIDEKVSAKDVTEKLIFAYPTIASDGGYFY